jgi:hypothetical protein
LQDILDTPSILNHSQQNVLFWEPYNYFSCKCESREKVKCNVRACTIEILVAFTKTKPGRCPTHEKLHEEQLAKDEQGA